MKYFSQLILSDMGYLNKSTYEQMQRISELYLADLQIDINEEDEEVKIE
jgi:hypothetical protein